MGVFAPHESRLTGPPTPPNGEFLSYKNRYKGEGNPNGRVSGRLGDTFLDEPTGQEWQKTSGDLLKIGWVPEGDSESLVLVEGSTTSRSNSDRWAEEINVLDFGADPTGIDDSTDAFEAAILFATAIRRTVRVPAGVYMISRTLRILYGLRMVGDGEGGGYGKQAITANPSLSDVAKTGQSVLFLAAGSDCPMFETNPDDGVDFRETTSVNDGRGAVTQKDYDACFEYLTFHGNARSQSSGVYNADIFNLLDAYNVTIRMCKVVCAAGYYVRAWNCNVVRIHDCILSGDGQRTKGILFYDTADSFITDVMQGASIGPAIWFASSTTWLNHVTTVHVGDTRNGENGGEVTSVAANVLELSQDPSLNTGDPFVFYTRSQDGSAAYSGQITEGRTYFWIRITATTGKFATTLPSALAGLGDTLTTIGTNMWVKPGPNSCLFLSEARKNTFTGLRCDNARDVGLEIVNGSQNRFLGTYILRPGFNDGGAQLQRVGLRIRSGSNNRFTGLIVDSAYQPIRIDAGVNDLGDYEEVSGTIASVVPSTNMDLTKDATTGEVSTGKINIAPPTGVIPVAITALESATYETVARTGSVTGSFAKRISTTQDGSAAAQWILADGASSAGLLGVSGDASAASIIVGNDGIATAQTQKIRGAVKSGTNVAGENLDIIAPGGTGNAAPGSVRIYSLDRKASGSVPQNVPSLNAWFSEVGTEFFKPIVGYSVTKAQRDALASPANGMLVRVTDGANPGLQEYRGGAWGVLGWTADP